MSKSKFSSLMQATQASPPVSEEAEKVQANQVDVVIEAPTQEVAPPPTATSAVSQPVVAPVSKAINMQPSRGKKGHPDYNQVTIYLKKDTQNTAKIALLQARDDRDFSELVEDLLTQWLSRTAAS